MWPCSYPSGSVQTGVLLCTWLSVCLICRFECHADKFWTRGIPLHNSQNFWDTNHSILISFHLLQFRHPFWTWSTTTMALMGARQWDAQLKEPLFLILSGWFAKILRSMEITHSFSICGQNVSSSGQRTSSAFYFFRWPFFLCLWFLFGLSLINYK